MIPELGHFALWLALGVSLVLGTVPLVGAQRGRADWMAVARPGAKALFVLIAFSFLCLAASFAANDFSVLNVASNSNSTLPLHFRIAASWGSHEGSMLLWLLMQSAWTVAVALYSRHLPLPVLARILAVMGLLSLGFLLFVLLTSNPFDRIFPAPADGRDLNPLLQDPGMIFHPPMLYMGYVGFSVAFAFAVAALIGGTLDAQWARWTRPWTTVAWMFLTIGIALGSGWAYYELGWGGWWFWDPVENASFMPWLVGTALIHSLAVTEKRGSFKSWTVLLAILAFSLSLLGTFLVRSGVLSSVHSFASDPTRGLFILCFLALTIGASLTLYAWRAPSVGLGARFALVSRETLLLANNVLLVVAMAAVLLGTLYPLILDAMGLGKISVGPPYFDTVFVPLMAPLIFLMGIGPLTRWKQAELPELGRRLRWAVAVAVLAAIGASWASGSLTVMSVLGLVMAFWIVASLAVDLWERVRPAGGVRANVLHRLRQLPRAMVGMMVAHLGVAVFIIGVTLVKNHEVERDVKMAVGDSTTVGGYTFTFRGVSERQGPNYQAARGHVEISRGERKVSDLYPEKRMYIVQRMPMTEAAIETHFTHDLYVSLGEPVAGSDAWIVRLYVKPFIDWIWGGCVIMAMGGLLAITDRRYRVTARRGATAGLVEAGGPRLTMKGLRFLLPLGVFAVLLGFLWIGLGLNPREVPSPLIGKPAPAFALARLDDPAKQIKREDLLGQVWMLNVWASWCVPCREEHPLVIELTNRGIVPVYGLNYKDTRAAANQWLANLGNPFQATLFDADGRVGIDFGVYGVPETFIVDKKGIVRMKHTGALTPDVVREKLEPLVKTLQAQS